MEMARAAAEMFDAVGYTHRRDFAEGVYRDLRDTVRRELIDEDMNVRGNCQSSQAIALYYGVFNEDERERAFSHLLKYIHEKGDAFDCGFIGMHCMFCVLADMGEAELAYRMLTRDEFPSYKLLIEEGYTALPEQFHTCGGGTYNLSMNHHFLGDISRFLTTRIAGLDVIDHKTVRIKPNAVSGIDHAEAYYELPAGKVSVRWERKEDGGISLDYSAPDGVKLIFE
jgi:alpha-L-rhamnosidase